MADTERIKQLRQYLNERIRITITDGRIFIGYFVCIDKDRNMILAATEEYRHEERRYVGLIMVPGKHLIKAEVENVDLNYI